MLQYAVDCRLDELLSTVYSIATKPPLTQSPFAQILPAVRAHACKMHLWKQDGLSLQHKMMNRLSRIGPSDCFMYSGVLRYIYELDDCTLQHNSDMTEKQCYNSVFVS